jgi:hypothetical protein
VSRRARGGRRTDEPRVGLTLYISAASPSSARALANVRRILHQFKRTQIELTVCDLEQDPAAAERDHIAFTPTLCKREPAPTMWILGDLSRAEPLLDLLAFYGVESNDGHRQNHDRNSRV